MPSDPVDESKPLRGRLERLRPAAGKAMVPYLGPAVITPVLHLVYPKSYGVFNQTLEVAMKRLDIWPYFASNETFADKYLRPNPVQRELASRLGLDLWTFDYLWWYIAHPKSS
jgi:hypothetical protein